MQKVLVILFVCIGSPLFSQHERFEIVTSDLPAFWQAFDTFKSDTTKNPFGKYIRSGTPGLKSLRHYGINDSIEFKNTVRKNLSYYEQVRKTSWNTDSITRNALPFFHRLKNIYPSATLPHVYLIVGRLNTYVATVNDTILFCVENFPATELVRSDGHKSSTAAELPLMLARGIVFTNQKPAHTGWSLLRQCILHGTTEFIMGLIDESGKSKTLASQSFSYGEAHEEQLVKEFLLLKDGTEYKGWLYNDWEKTDRPKYLGHWIGYKIVEAYYNNVADKSKAIDDILKINDFDRFLLLSGYTEPFRY